MRAINKRIKICLMFPLNQAVNRFVFFKRYFKASFVNCSIRNVMCLTVILYSFGVSYAATASMTPMPKLVCEPTFVYADRAIRREKMRVASVPSTPLMRR